MLKDKIDESSDIVRHESAGGFLFHQTSEGNLLVALPKKKEGGYRMPKGHIKNGETPNEAALREVIEELSLKIKPKLLKKVLKYDYSFSLPDDKRKQYKEVHVYIFTTDRKLDVAPLR